MISKSTAKVIILCGTFSFYITRVLEAEGIHTKTFILPPAWFSNNDLLHYSFNAFNCCLGFLFSMDTRERSNTSSLGPQSTNPYHTGAMKEFLQGISLYKNPQDMFLEDIWMTRFRCLSPNKYKNKAYEQLYNIKLYPCSGQENFTSIPYALLNLDSPAVYHALKTLAHALQAMITSSGRPYRQNTSCLPKFRYQVNHKM